MQTAPLPTQLSNANPIPARATPGAGPATDASQFRQALSRQVEQRQNANPPARESQPARPAASPAQPAGARPAEADEQPAVDSTEASDDAADAASATPVAEMLALVASFNQPLQKTVGADRAPATDAAAALAGPAAGDTAVALPAAAMLARDGVAATPSSPAAQGVVDPAAAAASAISPLDPKLVPADAGVRPAAAGAGKLEPGTSAQLKAAADPAPPARSGASEGELAALRDAAPTALVAPVQQPVSLAVANAAAGVASDKISARVGSAGWDQQVGQKIVWMVAGKEQSASLTLNPPDLGPMQVVLSVNNDQASVTFSSAQPEVRQALENAMPKLREMMGDSGITLSNATVNAGLPDQRQAQQGEQAHGHGAGARLGAAQAEPEPAAPTRPIRAGREGMVDTFA